MFKVNNKNVRWRRSGLSIVKFENISDVSLALLLLTASMYLFAGWKSKTQTVANVKMV